MADDLPRAHLSLARTQAVHEWCARRDDVRVPFLGRFVGQIFLALRGVLGAQFARGGESLVGLVSRLCDATMAKKIVMVKCIETRGMDGQKNKRGQTRAGEMRTKETKKGKEGNVDETVAEK